MLKRFLNAVRGVRSPQWWRAPLTDREARIVREHRPPFDADRARLQALATKAARERELLRSGRERMTC